MFVGELSNVSESVFVFDDVPLLVALFEIVGLFVLVIPAKRISLEVLGITMHCLGLLYFHCCFFLMLVLAL